MGPDILATEKKNWSVGVFLLFVNDNRLFKQSLIKTVLSIQLGSWLWMDVQGCLFSIMTWTCTSWQCSWIGFACGGLSGVGCAKVWTHLGRALILVRGVLKSLTLLGMLLENFGMWNVHQLLFGDCSFAPFYPVGNRQEVNAFGWQRAELVCVYCEV